MYDGLALFYNNLTYDIDYAELARFADKTVKNSRAFREYVKRGEKPILLDAGCGTGRLIGALRDRYDCIGLDCSEEMLSVAIEEYGRDDILWICQDMARMDLYGTVTAVISLTDSVNHLLTESKLRAFFSRAHNFLDPGGVLVFDVLSESRFEAADRGECNFDDLGDTFCFWLSRYSRKTGICSHNIVCFGKAGPEGDLFERTDDTVREKFWSAPETESFLRDAGFVNIRHFSGGTNGTPSGKTGRGRIYFVCEKEISDGKK